MPHQDSAPLRIAIAGGGIGGLSLAIGLLAHPHLSIHIYEGVHKYTDIGAGLALHKNALAAMDSIDPRIKAAYFKRAHTMAGEEDEEMVTRVELVEGPHTGEVVAELGRAKGRRTIARSDLLEELTALIPEGRISFGQKLVGIEELNSGEVKLIFGNGFNAVADCLIGADGVHSYTRSYLLGVEHPAALPKNPDGWQVHSRQVPMEMAMKTVDEKWRRTVPILCGSQGHVNIMPLHRGQTLSIIVVTRKGVASTLEADPSDWKSEPLEHHRFDSYREDAKAAVKLVASGPGITWALSEHDHAPFYSRGNIAMMGDAAHACMPFIGNGAAQALEDSATLTAVLGRCFSIEMVPKALAAFDTVRRPRSQKIVELARDFGRLYDFALESVGDDPLKMKAFMGKAAAFTNDADVASQNAEAIRIFETLIKS